MLLACAPVGQRYPRLPEAFDLVRLGLRARVRSRVLRRHEVAHPPVGGALPSSAPLPKSYAQALRTVWWAEFRPTVEDWSWRRWNTAWVRTIAAVIAFAGGVLLALGGYRHFFQYRPFTHSRTDPHMAAVHVGRTIWISPGLVLDGHETAISIDRITPRVLDNTAHAQWSSRTAPARTSSVAAIPGMPRVSAVRSRRSIRMRST